MADNDELLVQVEGEDQTDNEGEGQGDPVAALQKQYDDLKADNKKQADATARANRLAADERARAEAATREATEAKATIADSQLDGVVSRIAAASAEAEAAEKDYAAAAEAGDFKKQAEAQRRMARAESKATTLEGEKAFLESRRGNDSGGDREQTRQQPPRPVDPFEDHVSRFTERTAQWMREHRDWIVDPKKNAKVTGAHNFAVADGLTPDTDDYFEFVEKMIGLHDQAPARNGSGNGQQQTRMPARRVSPPVAPVNGGAGGHSSGAGENRGQVVTLTKGESEAAKKTIIWNYDDPTGKGRFKKGDPIGVQEYARRKLEMQKGGYYDRSYTES